MERKLVIQATTADEVREALKNAPLKKPKKEKMARVAREPKAPKVAKVKAVKAPKVAKVKAVKAPKVAKPPKEKIAKIPREKKEKVETQFLHESTIIHFANDEAGIPFNTTDHMPCRPGTDRAGRWVKVYDGMTVGDAFKVGLLNGQIRAYVNRGWITVDKSNNPTQKAPEAVVPETPATAAVVTALAPADVSEAVAETGAETGAEAPPTEALATPELADVEEDEDDAA